MQPYTQMSPPENILILPFASWSTDVTSTWRPSGAVFKKSNYSVSNYPLSFGKYLDINLNKKHHSITKTCSEWPIHFRLVYRLVNFDLLKNGISHLNKLISDKLENVRRLTMEFEIYLYIYIPGAEWLDVLC